MTRQHADTTDILRALDGDVEAYGEIMQRYEPKLLRYATYLVHDSDVAADVVQETFIRAYQNLRAFDTARAFSPWLYRIAHNQAMNILRKYSKLSSHDINDLPEIASDIRVDDEYEAILKRQAVRLCVQELPLKYREVVQLIFFEGMSYDAVSDVLHLPVSTVGVRLSRAKQQLYAICRQKGVEL